MDLFDESDDQEDLNTIKTNKNYAKNYNEFRKKEILSHLKNLSDDDDSSSSDLSTDEEVVDTEFDKEFFKTLAFLKNKNPAKYEKIPTFFENVTTAVKKKPKSKPLTVADYQRERLLREAAGEEVSDDDQADDPEKEEDLTYVQEQAKLKQDLKSALKTGSEGEESSDEEKGELFKVREKTKEDQQKEENDYIKWLADQKKDEDIGADSKLLKPLKEYWHSENISKADMFLRDYVLNKKYLENSEIPTYDEIVNLSEDEKDVEQADEFEHNYNFRFEEPDNEFIKRHPRNIDDTVRITDNSRKEKRQERKERKQKEKELKMKEIQELNKIRKREIEEKLLLLKQVAGNEDLPLQEDDLDSEFDPEEHDRRMARMFDNEYYGIDEGEQKPECPEIDEEVEIENWDNFDKTKVPDTWKEEDNEEGGDYPHCEDDDFIMDCDYDPQEAKKKELQDELLTLTKGKKRRKKLSRLAQLIKQEKPTYTPELNKTYEEYLDEYYKLDYEDVIGDQPCRFKYTECVPNDFGLTVEEILGASNKELNQWASLKKTMQNRPKNVELNDVEKYNRRRNNLGLKKKIFASIYGDKKEEDANVDEDLKPTVEEVYKEVREEPKVQEKKEKKKKNKKVTPVEQPAEETVTENNKQGKKRKRETEEKPAEKVPKKKLKLAQISTEEKKVETGSLAGKLANGNKKNNNKNKKKFKKDRKQLEISDERFKAFGMNPKKIPNTIKQAVGGTYQKKKFRKRPDKRKQKGTSK